MQVMKQTVEVENSLEEVTQQLTTINQSQAVFEFTADGKILYANDHFLEAIHFGAEEIKTKNISELYGCELLTSALKSFESNEIRFFSKGLRPKYFIGSFTSVMKNNETSFYRFNGFDISSIREELEVKTNIMNMTSIVSEADLKGDITSVNDKFIEVSKYSKEELIGKGHNTTRHPDMPKEVFKEMWSTIGRGNVFRGVVKNRAKDGTPYYVDAVIAPIIGENGKPKKYIGVRYEFTQAEIERQDAKGVLTAIDSNFIRAEVDLDGHLISCNKLFEEKMDGSLSVLKNKNFSSFLDATWIEKNYKNFWQDLRTGRSQTGSFKMLSVDNKILWIQGTFAPVMNEVGHIQKIVYIGFDNTYTKIELDGKMNALDKAQAIIEFNTDGSIISANENFLKTVGYSFDEINGRHHRIFCEEQYTSSDSYKAFWEKLRSGHFDTGRYKRLDRSGKAVWIQAIYNPIFDGNGKVFKIVKFATNVTAQVALEEEVSKIALNFATQAKDISQQATSVATEAQSLGATAEEMNASVEELSASIDSIAHNAQSADQIAKSTQTEADLGSQAIAKSIESMDLINKSSEEIGEIVKVISEIAGQTNLLAFNAAIEAARAGEHGLGFSVVADEVRKLAERSSQATKDISKLINESVKRVTQGGEVSKEAANSFRKIVEGVAKTTQAISEISVAAQEQQAASRDVAQSIQIVANATEKSANASDSIAQATTELANGADQLKYAVNKLAS